MKYYEKYLPVGENPAPGAEIPFKTARNFRELGGYEAKDGRHVKYGTFFRGIATGNLKDEEDIELLNSMGIRFLLDLRAKSEAASLPDYVPEGAEYKRICGMWISKGVEMDFNPEAIKEMMKKSQGDIEQGLKRSYGEMPIENPAFIRLFEALKTGTTPVLYHCSAGKDRTGIASILILLALGVDEQIALDDYELTNIYRRAMIEEEMAKNAEMLKAHPEMTEMIKGKEGVRRYFAEVALAQMKGKYGTYERYFEAEFGLNEERLNEFRDLYLE